MAIINVIALTLIISCNPKTACEVGILIPTLPNKEPKHMELKWLDQGHKAERGQKEN